ncbi:MAG: hypothetical protein ACFFCZ_22920 [Promethearchaeota archaeon]
MYTQNYWEKNPNYALLVKTDLEGIVQWKQSYTHSSAYTLIQTSDGGFALAGSTGLSSNDKEIILGETDPNDNWDVLLVRTDATGSPLVFPSPELSPDLRIIPLLAAVVMLVCLAILVYQNLRKRRKQL